MNVTDWQDEYFIIELEKWLMEEWENEEKEINIHPPQKKKKTKRKSPQK